LYKIPFAPVARDVTYRYKKGPCNISNEIKEAESRGYLWKR
jgi:hypothetical protein